MNGALFVFIASQREQVLEERQSLGPSLIFEQYGELEIDGRFEIRLDSQSIIEAFDRQVWILCGV